MNRPVIKEGIKKIVRKRCGYGCVICGYPLYHYDHIQNYSDVKCHNAENITLLCGSHHDEKTRGILHINKIIEANNSPHAINSPDELKQNLYFKNNKVTIKIASNRLYADFHNGAFIAPFIIHKRAPFFFDIEGGQLLLSGEFFDDLGTSVVNVHKNEIRFLTQDHDIKRTGSRIILRKNSGQVILDIDTNPKDALIDIKTAVFNFQNIAVELRKDILKISNMKSGTLYATVTNCCTSGNVGFSINSPGWAGKFMSMQQ